MRQWNKDNERLFWSKIIQDGGQWSRSANKLNFIIKLRNDPAHCQLTLSECFKLKKVWWGHLFKDKFLKVKSNLLLCQTSKEIGFYWKCGGQNTRELAFVKKSNFSKMSSEWDDLFKQQGEISPTLDEARLKIAQFIFYKIIEKILELQLCKVIFVPDLTDKIFRAKADYAYKIKWR